MTLYQGVPLPPVIYIAGPYRPKTPGDHWELEENIRRAERLALEVWRLGAAALCPHTNTRFFQGAAPDEVWLSGCLALLSKCDGILMAPDWESSSGARAERNFAEEHGIEVFETLDGLEAWLDWRSSRAGYGITIEDWDAFAAAQNE